MTANGRRILAIAAAATLALVLVALQAKRSVVSGSVVQLEHPRSTPNSPSNNANAAEPAGTVNAQSAWALAARAARKQRLDSLYDTPLAVYGKVVDQAQNPVSGATVDIRVDPDPVTDSARAYTTTTDESGSFALTGIVGIAFSVKAAKDGYYTTNESKGHRNIAIPANNDLPKSTKEQPLVLRLIRRGEAEPMYVAASGQVNVATDGKATRVNLVTDNVDGALEIRSAVPSADQRPFDWSFEISIPGGGLIERNDPLRFDAPAEGYHTSVQIGMAATAAKWQASAHREYFAALPDGRFARLAIGFYSKRQRNFVVVEAYVNPQYGSRNLEYDPNKRLSGRIVTLP